MSNKSNFYSALIWNKRIWRLIDHYYDIIMGAMASQITSLTIVYSTVYSDADQRKHQSSASLAFVRGIHRRPVNSPHKGPVTRKMFPFDYVIMGNSKVYVLIDAVLSVFTGENWPITRAMPNLKIAITGYICWHCFKRNQFSVARKQAMPTDTHNTNLFYSRFPSGYLHTHGSRTKI